MNTAQKKDRTDYYITKNVKDLYTINEGIQKKRNRHLNLDKDDILSIIYSNIIARLDKIEDKYFKTYQAFRSVYIQTIDQQFRWQGSDIDKANKSFDIISDNTIINEDDEVVTNEIAEKIEEQDEFYDKFNFIYNLCPKILQFDITNEKLLRLIIENKKVYSSTELANLIKISKTSAKILLFNFKQLTKFIYKYHNSIKIPSNLPIIFKLHPKIRLDLLRLINNIENNHNISIELIPEVKKHPNTSIYFYSLAVKLKTVSNIPIKQSWLKSHLNWNIEVDNNDIYQLSYNVDLNDIIIKYNNKHFIKNTKYVNI